MLFYEKIPYNILLKEVGAGKGGGETLVYDTIQYEMGGCEIYHAVHSEVVIHAGHATIEDVHAYYTTVTNKKMEIYHCEDLKSHMVLNG